MSTLQVTFVKDITIKGDLDKEQCEKLLLLGANCPIEQNITWVVAVTAQLIEN